MKTKDTITDKARRAELKQSVSKLRYTLDQERKKRDRRDMYLYGSVMLILVIGIAAALAGGKWLIALLHLTSVSWIAVSWTKDRFINNLRHTLDFMFGLRDIELKLLKDALGDKK